MVLSRKICNFVAPTTFSTKRQSRSKALCPRPRDWRFCALYVVGDYKEAGGIFMSCRPGTGSDPDNHYVLKGRRVVDCVPASADFRAVHRGTIEVILAEPFAQLHKL